MPDGAQGIMSRIKGRRTKAVKRRNPVARALRERAFRVRAVASRKKYSRKAKHRPVRDLEPPQEG
jgi:hypothetical protein